MVPLNTNRRSFQGQAIIPISQNDSPFQSENEDEDVPNDGQHLRTFTGKLQLPEYGKLPLYNCAPLTVSESLVSTLQYALRHRLSNIALDHLIKLLALHLPEDHLLPNSQYLFKKFFRELELETIFHYYCEQCTSSLKSKQDICQLCHENQVKSKVSYFIEIPIQQQIIRFCSIPEFYLGLKSSFQRKKRREENMEDFQDGELYKAHQDFFNSFHHLSFTWNTDGVSVFTSSNFNVWPIMIKCNSLPPNLRDKYIMMIGFWFGKGKPEMNHFLSLLPKNFNTFYEDGFEVITNGEKLVVKGLLQCDCSDLPASTSSKSFVGHNGYNGCQICEEPGDRAQTIKGTSKTIYPFRSPPFPLRTLESVRDDAKIAYDKSDKHNGVNGVSILFSVHHYDFVKGTIIDYMHGCCSGIGGKFMKMWFTSNYARMPWYLGKFVKVIDEHLAGIKPPTIISRTPRSIEKTLSKWKASEFRCWILYYSVPILQNYLPEEYFKHWCAFVLSLWILLSPSISYLDLSFAQNLLNFFYEYVGILYGPEYFVMNVHNLSHLALIVKRGGPLWTNSCFSFEDENGTITDDLQGTNNVVMSTLYRLFMRKNLPLVNLQPSSKVDDYLQMVGLYLNGSKSQPLSFLGKPFTYNLNLHEKDAIWKTLEVNIASLNGFFRAQRGKTTFTSKLYSKSEGRNNYTISFLWNNKLHYGQIKLFFKFNNSPWLLISQFLPTQEPPISETFKKLGTFITPVFAMSDDNPILVIPFAHVRPVILVKTKACHFVMTLVNNYEFCS